MNKFAENLREKRDFVNKVIEDIDLSYVHQLLEVPTRNAILGEGKRLRPIICMLCAEVVGGDYKETRDAFLALELIHNGTLVHDDIIDEDLFRRGRPSTQVEFGRKRAVLTGDALLSLGLKYAAKTGNMTIVKRLSETSLKMVQGVAMQTWYRRRLVSEATYLDISYLKSGSLFEAAAALGELVGSSSVEDSDVLANFGRNFGNAYQIRDDICGVYNDNNEGFSRSDILNGDVTLPFIYSLESDTLSNRDRELLVAMFSGKTTIEIGEVQRIYEDVGALKKSIEKMNEFAERGREHLRHFARTEAMDCLNYLLDQFYKNFIPWKKLEVVI